MAEQKVNKAQMKSLDNLSKLEIKNEKLIIARGYRAGYDLAKKSVKIMVFEILFIVLWLLMQTVNGPLNTLPFEVYILPIGVGLMVVFEVYNLVNYIKLAKKLKEKEELGK